MNLIGRRANHSYLMKEELAGSVRRSMTNMRRLHQQVGFVPHEQTVAREFSSVMNTSGDKFRSRDWRGERWCSSTMGRHCELTTRVAQTDFLKLSFLSRRSSHLTQPLQPIQSSSSCL
jgi:hypothetical protein